jgi:hypothetical protein
MRYKSHRNLLRWFLEDQRQLPAAYVASCEKFFNKISKRASERARGEGGPVGHELIKK